MRPKRIGFLAFLGLASLAPAAPLTLSDAIRLTLERNPSIKVESYSRGIARANLLSAYGRFEPSVNFSRSYSDTELPKADAVSGVRPLITRTQTNDYSLTLDGLLPTGLSYSIGGSAVNQRGTFNAYRDDYATFGGISVRQPLLRDLGFSSNLAELRLAKADRAISDWDYRQTVIDAVTNVIFTYNDLLFAHANLRAVRRSRELARGLLVENEKRFQAGSRSESDVTEAQARAAFREEAILLAERAIKDAENQLRRLIGDEIFGRGDLQLEPLPPGPTVAVIPAVDVKIALAQRPDYQAARFLAQKFRINDVRARNQLLPRVDFVGSYGYAGADHNFAASRAQVRHEDNAAWSAGVVVNVPLTLMEGRGRARSARLQLQQFEADLIRHEQEIAVAVANTAGQIETTQQRIIATKAAYELQTTVLDDHMKKLRAGTTSTFFVLQQQEILSSLESSVSRALTEHRKALAHYDRVLGRTLETLNITLAK